MHQEQHLVTLVSKCRWIENKLSLHQIHWPAQESFCSGETSNRGGKRFKKLPSTGGLLAGTSDVSDVSDSLSVQSEPKPLKEHKIYFNVQSAVSITKSNTVKKEGKNVIGLPKSDLTDGLLGLLVFFFSSAREGERVSKISPHNNCHTKDNSYMEHCKLSRVTRVVVARVLYDG